MHVSVPAQIGVALVLALALALPANALGASLRPGRAVVRVVRATSPADLWLVVGAGRCTRRIDVSLRGRTTRVVVGARGRAVQLARVPAGAVRVRLAARRASCRGGLGFRLQLRRPPAPSAPATAPAGPGAPAPGAPAVPAPLAGSSPFAARPVYVDPDSAAAQALGSPSLTAGDRALLARIAGQPQAKWFGDWDGIDPFAHVSAYVTAAHAAGRLPLLVLYDRPHRDVGGASAGGAASLDAYRAWIDRVAAAVTGPAAIVVEPDGLAQLDDLASPADRADVVAAIAYAAARLGALPGVAVYLDAGHSAWRAPEVMAQRLVQAGVTSTRGFATNVANYRTTADELAYAGAIARLLPGTHVVVDTGRNGLGPAPGAGATTWCNPPGRGLGVAPTAATGDPLADAFLWIKRPGESDGPCNGGPAAGLFWVEGALALARNAPVS